MFRIYDAGRYENRACPTDNNSNKPAGNIEDDVAEVTAVTTGIALRRMKMRTLPETRRLTPGDYPDTTIMFRLKDSINRLMHQDTYSSWR